METEANFPLVTASWLATVLKSQAASKAADVVVLDASWYFPSQKRDAGAEFLKAHIPGARFFDIDVICDQSSPYPHMLPSAELFTQHVNAMGIDKNSLIVIYDGMGVFSSPRAWWMFRYFGHKRVGVLDGGFKAWQRLGLAVEQGAPEPPEPYGSFKPSVQHHLKKDHEEVMQALISAKLKIVDARSAGRFSGMEPEPHDGLRAGHMPGAINLPYQQLVNVETGYFNPFNTIKSLLNSQSIGLDEPIIATCGSGVSACSIAFILSVFGNDQVAIYDGSWCEWGSNSNNPVMQGSAR
ncbi:MAG: 3-mercaptopyruvate sulfurtransferase [Alphaproteobacteria bacterium]